MSWEMGPNGWERFENPCECARICNVPAESCNLCGNFDERPAVNGLHFLGWPDPINP